MPHHRSIVGRDYCHRSSFFPPACAPRSHRPSRGFFSGWSNGLHISRHTGLPTNRWHEHRLNPFRWLWPTPTIVVAESTPPLAMRRISPVEALGITAVTVGVATSILGLCLLPASVGASIGVTLFGAGLAFAGIAAIAAANRS